MFITANEPIIIRYKLVMNIKNITVEESLLSDVLMILLKTNIKIRVVITWAKNSVDR